MALLLLVALNVTNLAMYQVIFESKAFVNELSCFTNCCHGKLGNSLTQQQKQLSMKLGCYA